MDDMGIFRTNFDVANPVRPKIRVQLQDVLVDTGSEYNWVPVAVLEQFRYERFPYCRTQYLHGFRHPSSI